MKIYTVKFQGIWLGGVALVVAEDMEQAKALLDTELQHQGLAQDVPASSFVEMGLLTPEAVILDNGDY